MTVSTIQTYLEKAFRHFNRELFDNKLPECAILLHRRKNAYGYFHAKQWTDGRRDIHEIALNPENLNNRDVKLTLSTLVHEMCHMNQTINGKPSRNGYHNREWAAMMEAVGLCLSSTGQEGGKKTGQKVSHYIVPDGLFDKAADKFVKKDFSFQWGARSQDVKKAARAKRASKTKYTCPGCSANAWAKPESNIMCGNCMEAMLDE